MAPIQSQKRRSSQLPENGKLYQKFRKIVLNFSTRIMGNVISKVLGFITIPIIARALGPEGYGQFNLIMVILSYTALIVDFGFRTYGVRESAKQQNSQAIVSRIVSARLTFALASILVSMMVIFFLFSRDLSFVMMVYIGYIWVIAQGLNIDYYYFGKKNMLIPAFSQISGQLIYVIAVIFFIKHRAQLPLLILFYSLYYLWASFMGIALFFKKNQRIALRFSLKQALAVLKKTFRLGICARVEMFQTSFAVMVIPAFLGVYALGIFSVAIKFFSIILLIFQAIMLALAPYLVKLRHLSPGLQRKYIHLLAAVMLSVGILASFSLYIGGEMILDILFGKSFGAAAPLFKLLCLILIPFTPITMILGSILIYFDLDKKYLSSTMAAGFITLVFTPLLVYLISLEGAVWALGLSNFANLAVSAYHVNRIIPNLFRFSLGRKPLEMRGEQE